MTGKLAWHAGLNLLETWLRWRNSASTARLSEKNALLEMSQQLRKIRPLVIFIWTWLPCGTRLFKDHSQKTCLGMIEIEKFGICYLNLKKSNLEMSNQLWWSNHFSNLIWIWLPSGARNFSWAILKSTNQSTVGKVPKVMQKFKYSPFVLK